MTFTLHRNFASALAACPIQQVQPRGGGGGGGGETRNARAVHAA